MSSKKPIKKVHPDRTEWYLDGKRHRADGPAVEWADGDKEWWCHGKLHREDGPAVEYIDGYKGWYCNGEFHREDGPAVEEADGYKAWYCNGKLHREDGPAIAGGRVMADLSQPAIIILRFLRDGGKWTAKEITVEVFGGNGRPRTSARAKVHRALAELETAKRVSRVRPGGDYGAGVADVWFAIAEEGETNEWYPEP